jgi:hypothetical protein
LALGAHGHPAAKATGRRISTTRKRNGATAPRLTQTQAALLRKAAADSRGRVVTSVASGRGPQGGRVDIGKRVNAAANALQAAGLLAFDRTDKASRPDGGYTIHIRDTYWTITPEGRAEAAKRNGVQGSFGFSDPPKPPPKRRTYPDGRMVPVGGDAVYLRRAAFEHETGDVLERQGALFVRYRPGKMWRGRHVWGRAKIVPLTEQWNVVGDPKAPPPPKGNSRRSRARR